MKQHNRGPGDGVENTVTSMTDEQLIQCNEYNLGNVIKITLQYTDTFSRSKKFDHALSIEMNKRGLPKRNFSDIEKDLHEAAKKCKEVLDYIKTHFKKNSNPNRD